jgi:hypothetical protein
MAWLRQVSIAGLFIGFLLLPGCSRDDLVLAKAGEGNGEFIVRIRDAKDDLFQMARRHRDITNDPAWHRNFLLSNYLSREITVREELAGGLLTDPGFSAAYDSLDEKKRLLELSTKGEAILLKKAGLQDADPLSEAALDKSREVKKESVASLYACQPENRTILVNGEAYPMERLPDDAVLFKVYGKPFDWKESRRIITLFKPEFANPLTFPGFEAEIGNLKDLLLGVETARNAGLNEASRSGRTDPDIIRDMALERFRNRMQKKFSETVLPGITEQVLLDYFAKNRDIAFRELDGKRVPMTFAEAREEIYGVVCEEHWQDFIKAWNGEMKLKYTVTYSESGITTMMEMETAYLDAHTPRSGPNLSLAKPAFASSALDARRGADRAFDGDEENSLFQSGRFTISWDGKNDKGEDMPSGVYFVRMIALENNMNTEPFISSRRMLLLK